MFVEQQIRPGSDWSAVWFQTDNTARAIVDRRLQMLAVNEQADRLISTGRCLINRDGYLTSADRRAAAELAALVTAARRPQSRIISANTECTYVVRAQGLGDEPGSPVGLSLRDLSEELAIEATVLGSHFDLTPSEKRVVVMILRGLGTQDIADQLQKSILTIRTHVKRVYAKLDVQNREQLFARVIALLFIS